MQKYSQMDKKTNQKTGRKLERTSHGALYLSILKGLRIIRAALSLLKTVDDFLIPKGRWSIQPPNQLTQ